MMCILHFCNLQIILFSKYEILIFFNDFSDCAGCFPFGSISFFFWRFFPCVQLVIHLQLCVFSFPEVFPSSFRHLFFQFFTALPLHFVDFSPIFNVFFKLDPFYPSDFVFLQNLMSFRVFLPLFPNFSTLIYFIR